MKVAIQNLEPRTVLFPGLDNDDAKSDSKLAGVDWPLLIVTLLLCGFGVVCIFSATHLSPDTGLTNYFYLKKQLIWLALAWGLFVVAWKTDYRKVMARHRLIYVANLLLLIAVLKLGHHEIKGAQRWISLGSFQLQPSEIAKIAVIITLAAYLSRRQSSIRTPRTLLISLLHVALPVLVIFKQPDLGTALVIMTIWLLMTFVAGAEGRHLIAIILLGIMAFSVLWVGGIIKPYQKDRLRVFVNSDADREGVGYHITQAMDAIGSGRLWGKGLFHGTQGQLGYIPEQHTDFIFTIVGEELGFVGTSTLVLLYTCFLWRACVIALKAVDNEGRLLASGIAAMFLYHIVVNIGMTIGIMPVTGVPLPFLSYGGSSILANLCAVGILTSVHSNQPELTL